LERRREGTREGTREGAVGSLCDKEEKGSTHFVHVFTQQAAAYATHTLATNKKKEGKKRKAEIL